MNDVVSQVKEKLDLAEFLKNYIQLTPAGKNFKGLCPFHKEKTPSFIASPDRQIWHCFGCGAGGDVVGFLMRYESLEFMEALRILAEKAGIDFQRQGGTDQRQYDRLYQINTAAKDFYKANLAKAPLAQKYFQDRGLKKETIEEFELGAAPTEYDSLIKDLTKRGYRMEEIEKAGLAFKTQRGTYMDRFRQRLMFPLYNSFGKVIAFTGRVMPGFESAEVGKYVNSPETPIFNKSKLLFGFHKSKNAIRETDAAVVVEGQMDLLMCWQDGVKNIIATSGTALTGEHLKALRRFAGNLILAFDSDEAGQAATERVIDLAQANDFITKVLDLSSGDPADAVKKEPGLMTQLVAKAQPAMDYYFRRYLGGNNLASFTAGDLSSQKKGVRATLVKIKNIYSPTEQNHWLKELSQKTGIEERFLADEMNLLKTETATTSRPEAEVGVGDREVSRRDLIAQRLLSLVSAHDNFAGEMKMFYNYLPERYQAVFSYLQQSTPSAGAALPPAMPSSQLSEIIDLISLRSSLTTGQDRVKLAEEFQDLLKQLKVEHLKDRRQVLMAAIKRAEQDGQGEALMTVLKEFDEVVKEMQLLTKV